MTVEVKVDYQWRPKPLSNGRSTTQKGTRRVKPVHQAVAPKTLSTGCPLNEKGCFPSMAGPNAIVKSQVVPLGEAVISISEQELSDSIPKVPLELACLRLAKEVPEGSGWCSVYHESTFRGDLAIIFGENRDIESDLDDSSSQSSEEWTDEFIAKDPMHYALRCLLAEKASQLHFKSISMDQRDFLFDFFNSCWSDMSEIYCGVFVNKSRMIHDADSGILMLIWLSILLVVVRRTE
ncbi:hypothetical protein Nepgr_006786 [Nepenthes gracilis]|uniref:Uncharacterized protein n=1 Tax=Nepenthes gracilis TaxID=150966 RepID=A0AAD3S5X2_NEPGR|nr:hypothetical protein Nepgr_006786 [Nepenthes gracilis]